MSSQYQTFKASQLRNSQGGWTKTKVWLELKYCLDHSFQPPHDHSLKIREWETFNLRKKLTPFFEQGLKMGFLSIVTDPMDEKKKDTITIEDRVGWGNKLSEQFTSLLDSISN